MANILKQDANGVVYEGLRDPTGTQFVAKQSGAVTTDSGGVSSAPEKVTIDGLIPATANTSYSPNSGSTTGASDNSFTFGSRIGHLLIQNNSASTVYFALDAAASTGSFVLGPGSFFSLDWPVTVLHLYTGSSTPINAANGIVLIGRV